MQLHRSGLWEGNPLLGLLYAYTDRFESFCRKNFNGIQLKLILSLFLGRKKVLDPAEKDRIRELGIYHLFVISGFHVSLLLLVLHFPLRSWGLGGHLLALIAMWSYVMLVGCSPPVLRAVLMATIFYLLTFFGLFRQFLNTLGIAAMLILALSPISLYSPSFQFSFLCLLAIGIFVLPSFSLTGNACRSFGDFFTGRVIAGHDREDQVRRRVRFFLEEKFQFYPRRVARWALTGVGKLSCFFWGIASCGWFIQWWTLPLTLYYSNTWVWTQCLFNLIFIPVFTTFLPLCLALFLTYWLPLGGIFVNALRLCSNFFEGMTLLLQQLAWVTYHRQPQAAELAAYFLLFLGLYYSPWRPLGRSTRHLAFLTPILLLIVLRLPSADPGGKLQITMLDVGQGESIHLRYPDGRDALVDTGGFLSPLAASSQTVGRRLVSRYLWKERIRSLQYILLTHGDTDHTQEYDFIRRAFPVRRLFLYDLYQEYRGPSVRILKAGDHFVLGEVEHFVLHPPEQALLKGDAGDPNNSSLVVLLRYKKFSMLLTGDIDASVEKALLPGLEPITILKAAHHGSRFSSSEELLEVVQPKLALISAGRKNVFGHPARATLTRLAKAGVPALSTSQWGSLRIETDGYGWKVFHYSIDQARFRELRLTPSP